MTSGRGRPAILLAGTAGERNDIARFRGSRAEQAAAPLQIYQQSTCGELDDERDHGVAV